VEGGGDIWIANADGTNPIKLTDNPAEDWWPKFSPDGGKIAFQSKRDGNFEIYVMNSDGTDPIRLTNNSADDEDPNWSPDGTKIAFISMRDGHYEVYTMNADGSYQTRITTTNGHAIDPDWKPFGRTMHACQDDFPILKGPYLGQKPPGMTPEIFAPGIVSTGLDELNSVFSPDGDEFYFCVRNSTNAASM
jgi:Tol biopolymer transport system component